MQFKRFELISINIQTYSQLSRKSLLSVVSIAYYPCIQTTTYPLILLTVVQNTSPVYRTRIYVESAADMIGKYT